MVGNAKTGDRTATVNKRKLMKLLGAAGTSVGVVSNGVAGSAPKAKVHEMTNKEAKEVFTQAEKLPPTEATIDRLRSNSLRLNRKEVVGRRFVSDRGQMEMLTVPISGTPHTLSIRLSDDTVLAQAGLPETVPLGASNAKLNTGGVLMSSPEVINKMDRNCVTVKRWTKYQNATQGPFSTQGADCRTFDPDGVCDIFGGIGTGSSVVVRFVVNGVLKTALRLNVILAAGCSLASFFGEFTDCSLTNFEFCVGDDSCQWSYGQLICNPFPPFVTLKPVC